MKSKNEFSYNSIVLRYQVHIKTRQKQDTKYMILNPYVNALWDWIVLNTYYL